MAGKKPVLSPISAPAPKTQSLTDLFAGLLEHARGNAGDQTPGVSTTEVAERFHWLLLNRLELAPEQRDHVNELIERAVAGDTAAEQEMRQLIAAKMQPTVDPIER